MSVTVHSHDMKRKRYNRLKMKAATVIISLKSLQYNSLLQASEHAQTVVKSKQTKRT